MTIPVGLATVQGSFGIRYATAMASAVLGALPLLVVFLFFQRHIVRGHRRHRPQGLRSDDRSTVPAHADHRSRVRGRPVDPRLYGSFVEHMGRCVYTGIYEPGHPTADDGRVPQRRRRAGPRAGRRRRALPGRQLRLRLPTGRTASARASERPRRLDLAWRSIETNQVGLDEFLPLGRGVGIEPMMAVNLGTRGVDAARDLVEYCNHPGGTVLVRPARGATAPPTRTASSCGAWATRWTARGRSGTRPPTSTAGSRPRPARRCGWSTRRSSWSRAAARNSRMPTFGSWEATVLDGDVRRGRLHLAAQLLRAATATTGTASSPARVDMDRVHRGGGGHRRPRARGRPAPQADRHLASTSGTSGTRAPFAGERTDVDEWERGAAR